MAIKFDRDNDGNVVNPPVLSDHERRISEIAATGDQDRLNLAYEDYRTAQNDLVKRLEGARTTDDPIVASQDSPQTDPTPVEKDKGGDKK